MFIQHNHFPDLHAVVRIFVSHTDESEDKDDLRGDEGDSHDVRLAISCEEPFFAVPSSVLIPGLRGSGTPHTETVRFYFRGQRSEGEGVIPSELTAKVVAMYRTSRGHPRTAMETISLPMSLAARVIVPSKEGKFKITLDVPSMPRLRALFSEMLETSSVSTNCK